MSTWDSEYYKAVKELDEAQRKLRKAEHDRERYARYIHTLQADQLLLSLKYQALQKERDALIDRVTSLEGRLHLEPSTATAAAESTAENQSGADNTGGATV